MKKIIAVPAVSLIIAIAAWYWMSPYFAVAGLRNAAVKSDTAALNERVDFPLFRADIKEQFSTLLAGEMSENLKGNPFAAFGMALAAKLTDVLVDAMITPSGLAALIDLQEDKSKEEVSGFMLLFADNVSVERQGVNRFDLRYSAESDKPTLIFARDGLGWRLVGIKMPKDFLADKMKQKNASSRPVAPNIPEWSLSERKDPMDDKLTSILRREADEEMHTRFRTVRPVLIFRCSNNKLEGYINVDTSLDYDYSSDQTLIRLRFDEGPPSTEYWNISQSRESVFAPNAKKLIDQLAKSERMRIEVKILGEGKSVASFTSGDLKEKTESFLAKCNINK